MIKNEFKKVVLFFVSMMGLMLVSQNIYSQTVQTFSTVGSQNWTCPAGITSVTVECWGAGGGSGGVANVLNAASGGGGGGAYAKSVISVTPGNTYSVFVGAGAAGGSTSGTSGANGGASSFNTNIVLADGGLGGGGSTSSTSLGAGGNGGGVATSIGTVKFGGGAGAAGILNISGGGGGSSAGNSTIGNNASTSTGGAAPVGGVAGASASTATAGAAGSNGFAGGGGASGSRRGGSGVAYNGAFGGNGKVVLSYVCTPPSVASTQTNNICNGFSNGAIDITVTGGAQNSTSQIFDQQDLTGGCSTGYADYWQSFTSGITGMFTSIDVLLGTNSPNTGNWYVYSGTGTGGVLLASGAYNFAATGGQQWMNIAITGNPQVVAGQVYSFRMSNAHWLTECSAGSYSGGTDNNGSDRNFKTYVTLNPYSYLWSNTKVSEDVNALLAGVYTCTVTDANSCVAIKTTTITQPTLLNATTVVSNVLCNGGSTGSINLTPSGGTPSYTFNWGGGITTEDRTGLPAGVYTCTITDANGCLTTKTSTVTQSPILSSSNVVTNVLCFGGSSGAINLTPVGGTTPYTFNWGGGIITEDRVSIPAGAYTCTITDVNSCTITASAIVNQPAAALSAGTTVTNVLCFGGSNGAINLTPAGGTIPYTFNWGGGITTEDRTGLVAGVYTCTVTDLNGCVTIKTSTVTQPATLLSAGTTVTNVSCFGGSNGAINLTPVGGTIPYTFNWGGGITTEDRTSLVAGVYTCTVTDVNTCSVTTSATITQPASALSASTAVTNVLCFGGSNGAINLTPVGGTTPYTFNWGGGIITEDRVSIPAGAYTCTITDVNSCTITASAIVNQPAAALSAGTTVTNVLCFGGSNGAINLTPVGGTIPYTFNWGGGITTEDRTGLVAGVYTCTVTDLNGCVTIKTSTVTQPAALLSAGTTVTNVSCFGGSNGAINLTPVGGTIPYTFNWGGGITTEDRTSLVAGVYTCTVTDVNTCSVTTSATITQPASALSASTAVTNVLCLGGSNGAINLTPVGGTTPYTFNWGGGIITEDRVSIPAGAYTCTITDVNSCTITASAIVNQPAAALSAGTTVTNVLCFGGPNGSINLTASGGTTPYTFNWGGGITSEDRTSLVAGVYTCTVTDVNTCTVTTSATITQPASALSANAVLSSSINCNGGSGIVTVNASGGTPTYSGTGTFTVVAGTYTYTVTDVNGCVKTTTINVTQPAPLTITVSSSSSSICVGAIATLTATGASTYTWNPGLFSGNTVTVSPTATTIYTATGTSSLGCVDSKTINLVVNSNPTVSAVASSSAICSGATTTLTGSGALTYTWNPGALSGSVAVVTPSATTNYTLIGTNASGCTNTKTISVTVNSNPTVSIVASPTAICVGSTATLTASGAISYIWNTSESTAIIEVTPSVNTGYSVTGTDASGCVNTETITLTVNSLPTLSLTASPSSVCSGATSTLTAAGANTYSWSTGSTLANIFENPNATTIYTVIGTDAVGCVNTETVNLTVNALPTLTISTTSNAVCVGNSATLTATGANTYSWSTGATTSSEVVSPTSTTVYTVVGIDAIGCMSSDTVRIYANSLPNVLTNVNSNTVCLGDLVVFSNLGANTFTLTPSALTGSLVNVPMNNVGLTVYTITGTGPLGCINSKTVSITTYDLPAVSISLSSNTICAGQSVVLNASGASTYTWTWSGFNSVSNPVIDFPSTNTSYSLTGTDINGCSNSASASINVASTPTVSINTPSTNVCMGYTMTISAVGASNYVWSTGAITNSINVQPFFNTTYSVVGSNGGECTDTVIIALTVLPLPSVSASASNTLVCSGQMINLSASGTATAYAWNPGTLIGSSQNVQVTAPITYTVLGQGANGCAFFSTVFIDTQSESAVTPIVTPSVICVGDSAILSVIGASVPSWSSNVVPNVNMVAPLTLTTYTYGAVDINGCSSVITFTVGIDEDCNVIIYNGFTPNGDGINDFWIIDNIDKYSNNKVYIYNRWGNEIYSVSDYNNTTNVWNGKANGQTITSGTYFFVIVDGSEKLIKKGWIEITN